VLGKWQIYHVSKLQCIISQAKNYQIQFSLIQNGKANSDENGFKRATTQR